MTILLVLLLFLMLCILAWSFVVFFLCNDSTPIQFVGSTPVLSFDSALVIYQIRFGGTRSDLSSAEIMEIEIYKNKIGRAEWHHIATPIITTYILVSSLLEKSIQTY